MAKKEFKLSDVIARLEPIMWDKYRVSWGLSKIKALRELPPDTKWQVSHSPGQFFAYALEHGEITQEEFDQCKVDAGSYWGADLVR